MHVATEITPVNAHSLQHQTQCRCLVGTKAGWYLTKRCATKPMWTKSILIFSCGARNFLIAMSFLRCWFFYYIYPTFMLSHHVLWPLLQPGFLRYNSDICTSVHSCKFIICHCYQAWYCKKDLVDSNGIYSLQPLGKPQLSPWWRESKRICLNFHTNTHATPLEETQKNGLMRLYEAL